jgi:O-antigen/teichoic acid export membrane protein
MASFLIAQSITASLIHRARAASDGFRRVSLREYLRPGINSPIVRNATWMLSGNGFQLLGRIGYFIIVVHALGPSGYGSFVACTALVGMMAPFAACGTGHVMIKYVARDRNVLAAYLGNALLVTVTLGSVLTLLALILRPYVLPESATFTMLIAVAIADLFGLEMNNICQQAFLALEQGRRFSQLIAFSTAARFVAAIILVAIGPTAAKWAYLYAASSVIGVIAGIVAVSRCYALPRFQLNLFIPSVREGFHFATSLASQSVYNDIDKTMLARLSTLEATAIYAAAYRFIEPAILPIRSVANAAYPEFFRVGVQGVTSGFGFARSILRGSLLYGLGTAVALFVAAGFVPMVLGSAFQESTVALRWLCLLPVIKCVHIFLSDTLTGSNYQWQTSSAQIAVAVFNIAINFWLIRAFSWRGAAWSSLATDGSLMVLLYMIIHRHLRRERLVIGAMDPQRVAAGEQ